MGVYRKRYIASVNTPMTPDSRLTPSHNSTKPASESAIPKIRALRALSLPAGSGRMAVRRIFRSASRSHHWLSAAGADAMRPAPMTGWGGDRSGMDLRNSHQVAAAGRAQEETTPLAPGG